MKRGIEELENSGTGQGDRKDRGPKSRVTGGQDVCV